VLIPRRLQAREGFLLFHSVADDTPSSDGFPDQEIRFQTTPDGVRIAYAIMGEGPPLLKAANWLTHLEFDRTSPVWRHWLRELSATHRLIRYDERGCGLSDWDVEEFSVETWVEDLETVVDAAGVERFPLLGISQGGAVAVTYAVRHPERVSHLILYGAYARGWARRSLSDEQREEHDALITLTRRGWGRNTDAYRQVFTSLFVPDADEPQVDWFNELQRISTSPENAARFQRAFGEVDVTGLLPRVQVPTLVLHCRDDARCPFEEGRRMAAEIPGARFVPLEGRNHIILEHEPAWERLVSEMRSFLGVEAPGAGGPGAPGARAGEDTADRESGIGAVPGPAATPDAAEEGFLRSLRRRKIVQWGLAYVTGAWVALQGLDLLEEPWGLSDEIVRTAQVLLAAGVPLTLVLAWYHGEKGRQRVSGTELVIIAILLAIVGVLLRVLAG